MVAQRCGAIDILDRMPPSLRFSYEIQVADLEALLARNAASRLAPPFSARYFFLASIQGLLWSLLVYVFGFGSTHAALSACAGGFVGGLWLVLLPGQVRLRMARRMRKRLSDPSSRFLLGPRTLEIDADTFAVIGADSESRIKWSALQRAVETPERIFLYVTGFTAHVVPVSVSDRAPIMAELRRLAPAAFGDRA